MSDDNIAYHITHEPILAETIDTSPARLGLQQEQGDTAYEEVNETDDMQSLHGRMKRVMDKTVEKINDKLGRSTSGKSTPLTGAPAPTQATPPRRMFDLRRKSKGKDSPESGDSLTPPAEAPQIADAHKSGQNIMPPSDKEAPGIRSSSPDDSLPSRPSIQAFLGGGSMRAGTQTLIQALQAIPWAEDTENEDEDVVTPRETSARGNRPGMKRAGSSIHAIYRPLERSRQTGGQDLSPILDSETSSDEEEEEIEPESRDEEIEEATPRPAFQAPTGLNTNGLPTNGGISKEVLPGPLKLSSRTGSMTTIRKKRRAGLAEKLREIFEIPAISEVKAEIPCWLLRSVLLQGYMYLTNSYLCFFAHMPTREDQILKSGSLSRRAQRTKRWSKHWFVLKGDALSWYQSSSDPYFPQGIIDLRYAISCEPRNDKEIKIRTDQKRVVLCADSVISRDEWVKFIRKIIFKAQNMGDSVKIAIPYATVVELDKSSAITFSETIEVKVSEKAGKEEIHSDSYFFAYFHDLPDALRQMREAIRTCRALPALSSPKTVMDTTILRPVSQHQTSAERERISSNSPSGTPKSGSSFKLTSLLRPFSSDGKSRSMLPLPDSKTGADEFGHVALKNPSEEWLAGMPPSGSTPLQGGLVTSLGPSGNIPLAPSTPPALPIPLTSSPVDGQQREVAAASSRSVGVPAWLRSSRRRSQGQNISSGDIDRSGVSEVYQTSYNSAISTANSRLGDMTFSVLESSGTQVEVEVQDKFRTTFAFDEKETLLGYFPGYIFRLLPIYGRFYVSTNFFCFKSSGLIAKTNMVLPIRDILSTEKSKATRFGHYGLVVIIKGYEELFCELVSEDRRNAFAVLLESQMEDVKKRLSMADTLVPSQGKREAIVLEKFGPQASLEEPTVPVPDTMTNSLPAVMFTSDSSTFLSFKPKESLHFTFLTIGSRGDVQPYISLSKGLQADGHRCRIATHAEFKDWVESYGIEFGYVGGDPAELMRICVDNGMFTISFMKEGLQKFRGWLDDLLKTSWEACQGTDILIESPSAMGGYHIAEAMKIPYFRAFTMPWTRTRAYPHAFAVPDRKMGGSYNYMTYVMFDQVFWRATSGQINRWRKNLLGLPSTNLDKMEPHKIPFLYNFSPVVVPPPLDWPEWIRVTGYWTLADADVGKKKWSPPNDLVEFIDSAHNSGKKIVYIGFGSIVVSDPKAMTKCVIDAVVKSGVCAVLSKGWSDRLHMKLGDNTEPEEPLPVQIYAISSVPHDWLFARVDAACHHGGAGTTGASLRAGIPTIIRPFFGDQFFWADRVEALGVGTGVRKLTVETLSDALITATTDVKQIERAKVLGESIRDENGVDTAIESIYRDLEYARSLIKHHTTGEYGEEEDQDFTVQDGDRLPEMRRSGSLTPGRRSCTEDRGSLDEMSRRSSFGASSREGRGDRTNKRNSIAAAVLSVLPDGLTGKPSHRRSYSHSSVRS